VKAVCGINADKNMMMVMLMVVNPCQQRDTSSQTSRRQQ